MIEDKTKNNFEYIDGLVRTIIRYGQADAFKMYQDVYHQQESVKHLISEDNNAYLKGYRAKVEKCYEIVRKQFPDIPALNGEE